MASLLSDFSTAVENREPGSRSWLPWEIKLSENALIKLVSSGALKSLRFSKLPLGKTIALRVNTYLCPLGLTSYSSTNTDTVDVRINPLIFGSLGLTRSTLGHEIGHIFYALAGKGPETLAKQEMELAQWEIAWGTRLGARPDVLEMATRHHLDFLAGGSAETCPPWAPDPK